MGDNVDRLEEIIGNRLNAMNPEHEHCNWMEFAALAQALAALNARDFLGDIANSLEQMGEAASTVIGVDANDSERSYIRVVDLDS